MFIVLLCKSQFVIFSFYISQEVSFKNCRIILIHCSMPAMCSFGSTYTHIIYVQLKFDYATKI